MAQLTLAILKPHVTKNPIHYQKIVEKILSANFKIVKTKRRTIALDDAEKFYTDHKMKFFYNRLVTYMTSGPSEVLILAKHNAILDWRSLMGPTKVYRAQFDAPESIRSQFGLSDTRNATHGSDSEDSAKREIAIFFPDFDKKDWCND